MQAQPRFQGLFPQAREKALGTRLAPTCVSTSRLKVIPLLNNLDTSTYFSLFYHKTLRTKCNVEYLCEAILYFFYPLIFWCCFCYFQGALYVLLNNRMLFLIVHYWEVMVDVWPVIVQVRILMLKYFSSNINPRQGCHRSGTGQRKIKILQGHQSVGEFYFEWGKIDILRKSQGKIKLKQHRYNTIEGSVEEVF